MKKLWMLPGLLLATFSIYAQNMNNAVSSPAETFAGRTGTILEKRFDEVNRINQVNIQLEYITDLSNHDKMACIRFDIQVPNNSSGPSALLDSNETNGLINFLKYITANVTQRAPVDPNTEISITNKYNLQIGCYWQKNSGWIVYIRTEADNSQTETDISQADIPALLKTLTLAVSEIKNS
jgi:hypothetical protein